MIFRGQSGFEKILAKELARLGRPVLAEGGGWVRTADPLEAGGAGRLMGESCFAHAALVGERELEGESVNQLAGAILGWFLEETKEARFEGPWPCFFEAAAGLDGLGRRVDAVERAFFELLKKRMGRVARLAVAERARGPGEAEGAMVLFTDFRRAVASRRMIFNGQQRMADDVAAPSRSYLKTEEAFVVSGREPGAGETVADLGAAPGGWSYSAAKRGARVVAVDNGPLKGGALNHPLIEHRREDAFRFGPGEGEVYDWLFCDLVEEPHHVLENLIEPWVERGWARFLVVNLKFGRVDPLALLDRVKAPGGVLAKRVRDLRVRHLYHDREEFTLTGEVIL